MFKPRKELSVYCDYCGLETTHYYTVAFYRETWSSHPDKIYLTFCAVTSTAGAASGCVVTKKDCMEHWFEQHETSPSHG